MFAWDLRPFSDMLLGPVTRLLRCHRAIWVPAVAVCCACAGSTPMGPSGGIPPVAEPPPLPYGQVDRCGTYTGSGPFAVTSDIRSALPGCLKFEDNNSATLDCQGHDVTSISLSKVQTFTIRDCSMRLAAVRTLEVVDSLNVTVDNVTVLGQVLITRTSQTVLTRSAFVWPRTTPSAGLKISCELCFYDGQNNLLSHSTVDGGWDGNTTTTYATQGVDSTVLINNQSGPSLIDNTLTNAFNAGIESVVNGEPVNAVISNNRISHTGITGILGGYNPGWQNSVFSGNNISESPSVLVFDSQDAKRAGVPGIVFVGNVIEGNTFSNAVRLPIARGGGTPPALWIDYKTSGLPLTIANNVIRNNDFGFERRGPFLAPIEGFTDGGGNICLPPASVNCTGSSMLPAMWSNPHRH